MNPIEKLKFIKNIKLETYNDYPQGASDNAKNALEKNAELGNKCATRVGKIRANQLMNRENISIDIIKRTFSFLSRAQVYSNGEPDSCGVISYNMWGGDVMLRWCENKLDELNLSKYFFVLPTPSTDDTEEKFISRCMRNNKMKIEFPESTQRTAVCYSQWTKR
jgi:hypothetical protein